MTKGREVPPTSAVMSVRLFDRVRGAFGLPDMPVIVADEIARQIDALPDPDTPDYTPPAESYGIVAPPFKQCFIEAATSTGKETHQLPNGQVVTIPPGTLFRGVACYDVSQGPWHTATISPQHRAMLGGERWIIAMWGYTWLSSTRQLLTFPGPMFVHLDDEGRILDDTRMIYMEKPGHQLVMLAPPDVRTGAYLTQAPLPQQALVNYGPFAMKAISAMHRRCVVEQVEPGRTARRLAQRTERLELHNYYVLKVKPTEVGRLATFADVGQPQPSHERREHRVRGHFRYYTDEKPLFGRYRGMVWVPEHERGNSTIGRITKAYEVTE